MPKENSTIGENGIFATRLRGLMDTHNISHQELADKLGVSRQAVSWYYFGKRQPNFEKLIEISEFFDVSTDYLLGVSEFRNYDEMKKIHESTEVFNQIEDPQALENMKNVFNSLATIGKNLQEQTIPLTNHLSTVVGSIQEMFSSYNLSAEKAADRMKLLEFKALSTDQLNTIYDSVKALANELAEKIKGSLEQDNDKDAK